MLTADLMQVLQWAGAVLGLGGSVMVASYTRISRVGWYGCAISNVLVTSVLFYEGLLPLGLMQTGFTISSFIGLWRSHRTPLAAGLTQKQVADWLASRGMVARPAAAEPGRVHAA